MAGAVGGARVIHVGDRMLVGLNERSDSSEKELDLPTADSSPPITRGELRDASIEFVFAGQSQWISVFQLPARVVKEYISNKISSGDRIIFHERFLPAMAIIIRWLMNANRVPVYTSDLSHELRTYIDRPTWKTVNTLRNLPLFEAWHDQNWVAGNTPKAIFCSKEVGDEPPKSVVDAFASWGHARKELENVQECESCSNNTSTTIGALVAALRKQSEIRFQRRTLVAPTCSQKREFPDETNKVKEVIKRLDEIKQELFLLSRSDNNHRVWPALEEAREHLRMERRMWYPAIPDGSKEQSATLMPRNFRIFEDIVDLSEQFAGKHNSRLKIEAHSLLSMLEIPKTVFIAGHAFLLGKWKEKRLAQEATKLLAGELPMDHIFIPDCQFELPTKFFNLPGRPPKRTISQVESASSLENGSEPEMKRSKSAGYFASSRLETLTPDPTSNINGEQSHVTPAKALSQHHGTLKGTSY